MVVIYENMYHVWLSIKANMKHMYSTLCSTTMAPTRNHDILDHTRVAKFTDFAFGTH